MPYDQGHPSPTGPLARVVVAGEPLPMKLPAEAAQAAARADRRQRDHRPAHRDFSATAPEAEPPATGRNSPSSIDGKMFDPGRVDQRVRLGAVEEWTIRQHPRARRPRLPHPHQSVPGDDDQRQGAGRAELARYGDRARARAAASPSARAFSISPASTCLHCHMMNHEEMGMMQTVEVYKS